MPPSERDVNDMGYLIPDLISAVDCVLTETPSPKAVHGRGGAMKLIRIVTTRGRRQLVLPEDLQIKVGADGFIRAYSDWGPLTEKLLPFDQAIEINGGGEDELQP